MAFKFVLLVLPTLAIAKINIEFSGKFDNLELHFSGQEINVISDTELASFQLSDGDLKNGVERYFSQRPDDVFVRSPTPWGDLYRSYGWKQVTRTLIPKRGRILSMESEPQIIMQQIFENNKTKPTSFKVGISQNVHNTMTSTWTNAGELTVNQEIGYEFNVDFLKFVGRTSLAFSSPWGRGFDKSQAVTVGAESRIELVLQPGQAVLSKLEATRGTLKVEMEYEASLNGDVAANFDSLYKGHHFWALGIDKVMERAGLNNNLVSKQIMEFNFFANPKVIVSDTKSNVTMLGVAL